MELSPDTERPTAEDIAAKFRDDIANGTLQPGDQLPAGRKLASQYGVALMTVQGAYGLLGEEGLVVSQQGRGTFVRDPAQAAGKEGGGSRPFATLATEISAIHETLQRLDARLKRLEQLVDADQPESSP